MSSYPCIAIIGAGPGGLLLARYLQVHSIPCTIYEREPSAHYRNQGGSLDLHPESGQLAIKEAGLQDEVRKYSRKEAEQMKVLDKDGKVHFDTGPDDGKGEGRLLPEEYSRPEIDRTDLRDVLLNSLEKDTIQWDHHFTHAEPLKGYGGFELHFSNTTPVKTDILIGADGAWSHVRPLLTPVLPIYSGLTMFEFVISDVNKRFPHLASILGNGLAFITSDGKGLLPQWNSHDLVRVYACFKRPESWIDEHPLPSDPNEARRTILALFENWNPSVLDFINSTDDSPMVARKIYALPPSFSWETKLRGITLLGDAAHVMSPFAGEGVNLALMDAFELGRQLVDALTKTNGESVGDAVDAGMREFEIAMWERAKEKAEESAENLEAVFAEDAPKPFVEIIKSLWPGPVEQPEE